MARIGLRNLKTALAVFLSMLISKLLRLEFPFFVVIAAIISMENSLLNSFKAGKNRMLGTMIGAGMGLVCALIRPGNALLCGVGMIGVIYLCNLLKWRKPISMAGVMFMAVMVSLNGKSPVQYSFNRILDTFIGITVAVAVNYLVFPPDYLPKIRRSLPQLLITAQQLLGKLLTGAEAVSLEEYDRELARVNELFTLVGEDSGVRRRQNRAELAQFQVVFDWLQQLLQHLRILSQIHLSSGLDQANRQQLQKMFGWSSPLRHASVEPETDIVFNFHLRHILDLYQNLQQSLKELS